MDDCWRRRRTLAATRRAADAVAVAPVAVELEGEAVAVNSRQRGSEARRSTAFWPRREQSHGETNEETGRRFRWPFLATPAAFATEKAGAAVSEGE